MARTFQRGLAVLEAVVQSPIPLGIQRVAELTGLDKATSMRMLQTLCGAGYLLQNPDTKAFVVTDKLQRLTLGAMGDQELRDLSHPHIAVLRDALGETTHLGMLRNDRIVYIDKLESPRSIRLVSAIGQEMPLHCTALGKAILAALPEVERNTILRRLTFERRTAKSITSPAALTRELATTRRRGWALDEEENEDNATCIAVAIVDTQSNVLGAISVSGPTFRMAKRTKEIVAAVQRTATMISNKVRKRKTIILKTKKKKMH